MISVTALSMLVLLLAASPSSAAFSPNKLDENQHCVGGLHRLFPKIWNHTGNTIKVERSRFFQYRALLLTPTATFNSMLRSLTFPQKTQAPLCTLTAPVLLQLTTSTSTSRGSRACCLLAMWYMPAIRWKLPRPSP